MKPRYLIVDDEPLARSRLERLILEIDRDATCVQAANGFEAITKIELDGPWTSVFLDVEMPGLSGLDVAEKTKTMSDAPSIIFCTAFSRYAVKAFQEAAVDYLVKPVEINRLRQTLLRASQVAMTKERLFELSQLIATKVVDPTNESVKPLGTLTCRQGEKIIPVSFLDVILLKADRKVTCIYTLDREFISDKSLDDYEMELPSDLFFRCHRSSIINLKHVLSFSFRGDEDPQVTLRRQQVAPVSRRKKSQLKDLLGT